MAVGKTVYVNKPSMKDMISGPNVSAHEQQGIRKFLLNSLADPRISRTAMLYRTMAEINPTRDAKQKGSVAEINKLAASVGRNYARNGIWFDQAAFDKAVIQRIGLEEQSSPDRPLARGDQGVAGSHDVFQRIGSDLQFATDSIEGRKRRCDKVTK